MNSFTLSHLADHVLMRELAALVTQDHVTTAALLAHLAEVDERKLYLPAACSSMFDYCVRELGMSEDTALKRIRVARTGRKFPAVFAAISDGRLHLGAVILLTPYLTADRVEGLLTAAAHKSKTQIELLLSERFPRPDVPTHVHAISARAAGDEPAARQVETPELQLAPGPVVPSVGSNAPGWTEPLSSHARLAPLSPGRFALQLTVDEHTHGQLRYAQSLLGHAVPSGDLAEVIRRAVDALVQKLEQQKFAKSARSGARGRPGKGRYIPADIRRIVWERDGGQCTFVSETGKRCASIKRLEFDHMDPVASGGQTTVECLRLLCASHNQHAAECTFGAEFMRGKRQEAKRKAAQAKLKASATAHAVPQAKTQPEAAAETARQQDVVPWLRQLGFGAKEARRGDALCAHIPDAPLEERVRVALRGLAPACARRATPVESGPG